MPTDDHYTLLGVTPDVSDKDLAKAYKRAALIWHPDKNVTRMEEAATMFDQIKKSYDVLSDPTQRASFDQKKRAEIAAKERDAKLTGKRKQMKEDLQRREQESAAAAAAAAAAARAKSSSFAGGPPPRKKSKTSQAVDELRKQSELQRRARDRMMEARADAGRAHLQQAPGMTASAPAIASVPATVQQQVDERSLVVVVKWKRKRQTTTTQTQNIISHSAASLKDMLEKHCGPVENVILGKKGNRAVVEFTSFSSVEKAVRLAGALHLKITPQENGDSKEKKKVVMKSNVAAAAPGTMATADFEASVLAKLRRS